MTRILTAVFAALLFTVACGKKVNRLNAGPNDKFANLQPTTTTPGDYEGTWVTLCNSKQIKTVKITGDLMTYIVQNYADSNCTQPQNSPKELRNLFTVRDNLGSNSIYNHILDYGIGHWEGSDSEGVVKMGTELSFEYDTVSYKKQ